MNAADLPVGSVVADEDTAFIKVEYEPGATIWCVTSLAVHHDDYIVDGFLGRAGALLREGTG